MSGKLTYLQVITRCKEAAQELTPEFPTEGTRESWGDFLSEVEDFDSFGLAYEEVGNWDWTIYTHYGFEIFQLLSYADVTEAESEWLEHFGPDSVTSENFGVYEIASQVAFLALIQMVSNTVEETLEELREVAETTLENLE